MVSQAKCAVLELPDNYFESIFPTSEFDKIDMSRRSCYGLEITDEDINARIGRIPEPTDEQLVRRTSQFIRRKRNSYKDHRTLSDVDVKYYSLGSIRAQLHNLSTK